MSASGEAAVPDQTGPGAGPPLGGVALQTQGSVVPWVVLNGQAVGTAPPGVLQRKGIVECEVVALLQAATPDAKPAIQRSTF